jgi:drug/metabolite transporter (DMT)-like permease
VNLSAVSTTSALALVYLIIFGSLMGFSAYIWLLRVTTPTRAATYAYVNPVVAVFLGWALAGEAITGQTIVAAGVIIAAVVIITTYKAKKSEEREAKSVERRTWNVEGRTKQAESGV